MVKGWVNYGPKYFLSLGETISAIELEMFAKEVPVMLLKDTLIYDFFKNYVRPLPVYRRWGVPNG